MPVDERRLPVKRFGALQQVIGLVPGCEQDGTGQKDCHALILSQCRRVCRYSSPLSIAAEEAPRVEKEHSARIVWALAWPAVALNSLQVVNSLLDSAFIGHLDQAALTAYGGITVVVFLLFSLSMALGTGATALVARAFGAGKVEEFRMACRQSMGLAVVAGLVLGAIGAGSASLAAGVFLPATDQRAIELMKAFLVLFCCGLPAIFIVQTLAGAMRGIGDTKSPMVISGLQIVLHIALNFVLIFPPRETGAGVTIPGFNLGLTGAATALASSAWMAAIVYVVYSARTPLGANWRIGRLHWSWCLRILRIAVPAAVMAVLRVGSLAVFTLVLKSVPNGSLAIAAMRPGFAIESMMFMPSFGLSMAAAALVGQSLGMGKPDRAERLGWTAGHHAALVTLTLCAPIFIFAPQIAAVLIEGKPAISSEAAMLLRYLCVTEVFFAYAMVMIGAMQGAGDTVRPLWITIVALWFIRVPMAAVCALATGQTLFRANGFEVVMPFGLGMGAEGAWLAMSVSQAIQGALAIALFKQGQWKSKKV
jgi:putative MATE family efflux protein